MITWVRSKGNVLTGKSCVCDAVYAIKLMSSQRLLEVTVQPGSWRPYLAARTMSSYETSCKGFCDDSDARIKEVLDNAKAKQEGE